MGPDYIRTERHSSLTDFPRQGEEGIYYIDLERDNVYLWENDHYVEVENPFTFHPIEPETPFGQVNFDTPIIHISNPTNWDADGDIQAAQFANAIDTTTYAAEGFITNYFQDAMQRIRIGNLDLSDPESFYDFLKMWPLYNDNGQVIGLFYSKELRDQAKEQWELKKLEPKKSVNRLKELLKKSIS